MASSGIRSLRCDRIMRAASRMSSSSVFILLTSVSESGPKVGMRVTPFLRRLQREQAINRADGVRIKNRRSAEVGKQCFAEFRLFVIRGVAHPLLRFAKSGGYGSLLHSPPIIKAEH